MGTIMNLQVGAHLTSILTSAISTTWQDCYGQLIHCSELVDHNIALIQELVF